ncbi:MAG: hypothetical protein FWE76_01930 [Symbiobacteriaceae bacterium]|nr:hypothetical protein [Symbiobacteriaceae bacterium]
MPMLIEAICQELVSFYPEVTIYTERVLQGMVKPCFSVILVEAAQNQIIGNRYRADWLVVVRYFPEEDGTRSSYQELRDIAQKLFAVLDVVSYVEEGKETDIYAGMRMNYIIEDNVLQFMVTYPFMLKKDLLPVEKMRQLEADVKAGVRT